MTAFYRHSLVSLGSLVFLAFSAGCSGDDSSPASPITTGGTGSTSPTGGGGTTATGAAAGTGGGKASGGGGASVTGGAGGTGAIGTTGGAGTGGTGAGAGTGGVAGGTGATPGAGGGTTAGSGGAAAALTLVEPLLRTGKYVLEFGNTLIEVDPTQGARISKFSVGGTNILNPVALDSSGWLNGGSTYWTSPQKGTDGWSASGWPPVTAIDSDPYTAALEGSTVALTSKSATLAAGTVVLEKRFTADLVNEAVDIEYTLKNTSTKAISLAGWEISRVPLAGLTFFPTGSKTVPSSMTAPPVTSAGGITWFAASSVTSKNDYKLNADGADGWLAHVTAGGILFLKTFDDVPAASMATGEGEVEIYTNGASYIEIENQGAFGAIPAAGTSKYKVTWAIRKIPASVTVAAGDAGLIEYVKGVVAVVK